MKTVIVIPCYNEEKRLATEQLQSFLSLHAGIHIIFVNDGSTDQTSSILKNLTEKTAGQAQLVDLAQNVGKAEAVRQGLRSAWERKEFDLIGFWDADFSTPLEDIEIFCKCFELNPNRLAVVGSRIKKLGNPVYRKTLRHYFGRVFATCASIILNLPVYDTQCGAKIFRAETIPFICEAPFRSRWFFDIEVFFRIKKGFPKAYEELRVYECPVTTWEDVGDSRLTFKDFLKTPLELIKIWKHYREH